MIFLDIFNECLICVQLVALLPQRENSTTFFQDDVFWVALSIFLERYF